MKCIPPGDVFTLSVVEEEVCFHAWRTIGNMLRHKKRTNEFHGSSHDLGSIYSSEKEEVQLLGHTLSPPGVIARVKELLRVCPEVEVVMGSPDSCRSAPLCSGTSCSDSPQ